MSKITESITNINNIPADIASKQDPLVSGTNIKTVNSTSLLGSGDVAVQPTLVSGTNIKTIGGVSLLGSTDIGIYAPVVVKTTGTQANSTVTAANITQLTVPLTAVGTYEVMGFVTYTSANSTAGASIGYQTGHVSNTFAGWIDVPSLATGGTSVGAGFPRNGGSTQADTMPATTSTVTVTHTAMVQGIVTAGVTTGSFSITFASEIASSAITVQIGSVLKVTRIA